MESTSWRASGHEPPRCSSVRLVDTDEWPSLPGRDRWATSRWWLLIIDQYAKLMNTDIVLISLDREPIVCLFVLLTWNRVLLWVFVRFEFNQIDRSIDWLLACLMVN